MNNWHGIMKVLEFNHLDKDGNILYQQRNILNTLHTTGEEFILSVLFQGLAIPEFYYLGLDNRSSLAVGDTMATVSVTEPSTNAYERQSVDSTDWTLVVNSNSNKQTNSSIVTYRAVGGSWGPIKNIFLTDEPNNSGYLIASAQLSEQVTVSSGEIISMRFGFALRDYPLS